MSLTDFQAQLLDGMPENSWDYAILDFKIPECETVPSLCPSRQDKFAIGKSIFCDVGV